MKTTLEERELDRLYNENTMLEARLKNRKLKAELDAAENSGGMLIETRGNEQGAAIGSSVESEEAQTFRLLTSGLNEKQIAVLLRMADLMRKTGIDKIEFEAL